MCHILTFSTAKKRMSVVVQLSATRCRIFTKGASEIVLELCTSQLHLDGSRPLLYTSQAYRTLCLTFRDVDTSPDAVKTWPDEVVERDLTHICIVGIEDPVREEVPESIRQCNEAGIVVRMPFLTFCGTPCYLAPAIIHRKTYWGQPVDVWPL
ncbi:hypothetical protein H310_11023 [Aphanomyces invadans]|uniref:Protein kinase domain-containing protein n=1 Tax=Aphanomyces invadans TaxID=157072 RepID=A0A024TNJ0_9STRA|nr:hypothetical protein H310_11023 [Aphanomyces invadans]ETV95588.1 hypothetical protein H310_11023 [Aphanomyces invadans]|eukprot:XP_008875781.1 hypothetical protein H310_11023 [Aphanomyces invadans]